MNRLHSLILRSNPLLSASVLSIIYKLFSTYVLYFSYAKYKVVPKDYGNIWFALFGGLVFAPFVETILHQVLFTKVAKKYITKNNLLLILLSSLVFTVSHNGSCIELYVVFAVAGALLQYMYLFIGKSFEQTFWLVVFAHFFMNFLEYIASCLFLNVL